MEERKATLEAGLLQLKAAEVVDRQSQSQLVSGRMQKDVDVLGSGVGAGSFVRHDIDLDGLTVDCLYRGDAADSEQETSDVDDEPLERAGVWTEEEVAVLTKQKLVHLQGLYINQFKRLRHVLQVRYRHYCREVEQARRAATYNLEKTSTSQFLIPKQQSQAYRRYKRRSGVERLLHQQSRERRRAAAYGEQTTSNAAVRKSQAANSSQPCAFIDQEISCVDISMPFSKYCHKHICSDPDQQLYSRCSYQSASGLPCDTPVSRFHKTSRCLLHIELPALLSNESAVKDIIQLAERINDSEKVPETLSQKTEQSPLSFRKYLHLNLVSDRMTPSPLDITSSEKRDGDTPIEECLKRARQVSVDSETSGNSPSSGNLFLVKLQPRTIAQLTNEQLQRASEEQGVVIGSREGSVSHDDENVTDEQTQALGQTVSSSSTEYASSLMTSVAPTDTKDSDHESDHAQQADK